jgi:GNAT superfamily N-acetyltransferase
MEVRLRSITRLEDALRLAPALDRYAQEVLDEFRDEPLPAGVTARFLERRFADPQTVLLIAESQPGKADLGALLIGPAEDPLLGTTAPLVLVLYVQAAARHKGIATELVREGARVLQSRGLRTLSARAGHNDDALISMGERWGFVRQWEHMVRE